MKKRVALVALLIVGGLVSVGALLMWGPFSSTPEASATPANFDLVAGRTEIDVGDVAVVGLADGLHVTFTANPGQMLEEVHVCLWEATSCTATPPAWSPPGRCPWSVEPPAPRSSIEVVIPWDDPNLPVACWDVAWIQAHAAMASGQTAYGAHFKKSFCLDVPCCTG